MNAPPRPAAAPAAAQWRGVIAEYRDLLPVDLDDEVPVDLGAGFTPLVRADRLAAELGLGELWIKDDTANPTGSFKDRVVSVALTKARQLGFKVAACASLTPAGSAATAWLRQFTRSAQAPEGRMPTTRVPGAGPLPSAASRPRAI